MSNPVPENLPWHYILECPVKNYSWGDRTKNGYIRTLINGQLQKEFSGEPLAELWMGAHPSAPARILPDDKELNRAILENPEHFLGPLLTSKGERTLPFLFKILNAAQPLSIQTHPDKKRAKILHKLHPEQYPDENHKPEIAVSLDSFSALVGLRPKKEIENHLAQITPLRTLCEKPGGEENRLEGSNTKKYLRNLLLADPGDIEKSAELHKINLAQKRSPSTQEDTLFLKLCEQFGPSDPGIFCIYFLNLLELKEGEGVFLAPNVPHAYLSGTILECMASSDNVVRAGLTEKFRDTETLLEMLDYSGSHPTILKPALLGENPAITTYSAPTDEFKINRIEPSTEPIPLNELHLPSILLSVRGETSLLNRTTGEEKKIGKGDVIYLPGDLREREIELSFSGTNTPLLFQAIPNL